MKPRLAPNSSVKNPTGRRIRFVQLFGAGTIGCAFLLVACSEPSDGLEERVTQMQKELDRTQGELKATTQALQASKDELAQVKGNAPGPRQEAASPAAVLSAIPSRDALEASYMAEAKTLKKQLQGQLKDLTLGSFTLHNVQLPDNQFPITSWISLAFQASDGKQCRLDFAVKADSKGSWVFPELSEIVRRAAEAKKSVSSETAESKIPKTAPNEPQPNVVTTMPSTTTSVIQWPSSNNRDPAQTSNPPAKPNPETAPTGPQTVPATKQTLPAADRDVLIRF